MALGLQLFEMSLFPFEMYIFLCFYTQAELNEVLEDDEEKAPTPVPSVITSSVPNSNITPQSTSAAPSGATGLESCLVERIDMYKTAISNAKATGESSKVRRYDRGLKVNFQYG